MKITVETLIKAPVAAVWATYTTPDDIKQWNTASADWHTTQSTVDLRVGGAFSSRMEAKDGSFGFDLVYDEHHGSSSVRGDDRIIRCNCRQQYRDECNIYADCFSFRLVRL